MTDSELIGRTFNSVRAGKYGISLEEFRQYLVDWELHRLVEGGSVVGVVMQKGAEVHIAFFAPRVASIRRHLRAHLGRVISEFGAAETYVEHGNQKSMRFCIRLGFYPIGTCGRATRLRCQKFKYGGA
ncbi:hypothetical protein [Burkholderia metallica]|uniref:hypothetical protein n=1 Tax=Burkholderia metallica TaxID=488729 RepID=UPI0012F4DCAC|nr:hypothetical protein [Burkholderia metallica]